MKYYLTFVFFSVSIIVNGQSRAEQIFDRIVFKDTVPANLLDGKTLVLVDMPTRSPSEYDRITTSFHSQISRSGIDPVIYYPIHILFSGTDVTISYLEDFEKREIQNLILLQYRAEDSRAAILPLNQEVLLGDSPLYAWFYEGEFRDVTRQVYLKSANSGLERKNFLINTLPEKGLLTNPIKGRRADFFSLSLKSQKLAVPKTGNASWDNQMENLLADIYPWEYEIVSSTLTDDELEEQGFQYVLRHIGGPIELVREYLNYEIEEESTAYISMQVRNGKTEARPISKKSDAYKFYIKELRDETIYLGTEWDADVSFIEGLISHINSVKEGIGE